MALSPALSRLSEEEKRKDYGKSTPSTSILRPRRVLHLHDVALIRTMISSSRSLHYYSVVLSFQGMNLGVKSAHYYYY